MALDAAAFVVAAVNLGAKFASRRLRPALLARMAWLVGLPVVAVWLLAHGSLYSRVDAWLLDHGKALLAAERYFDDVVVLEIDEHSLVELRSLIGPWPFPRDAYAVALDYLAELQARAVFVDVLLSDEREGDESLRRSLRRYPDMPVVLAASAVNDTVGGAADGSDEIPSGVVWPVSSVPPPALQWAGAVLPGPFLDDPAQRIGLISFQYDPDGVLRRFPLLHQVGKDYLPSAALALMRASAPSAVAVEQGVLTVAGQALPVDATSSLGIRYPANPVPFARFSFVDLIGGALGIPGRWVDPAHFRDRVVIMGKTSLFADQVNTPQGVMSGVHVLALTYAALAERDYFASAGPAWAVLMVMLGVMPGMFAARSPRQGGRVSWKRGVGIGVAVFVALILLHGGLLLVGLETSLLAPLLILLMTMGAMGVVAQRDAIRTSMAAADELAERQRRAIAMLSHELKSPLATIDMTLQNLGLAADLPPAVQARHQKIQRASQRLLAMITHNLDEDRLYRRIRTPERHPLDLLWLGREVVAESCDPAIQLAADTDVPAWVEGDSTLLRIALRNLIDNARKYSSDTAPVDVVLHMEARWVNVMVIDRGQGICEDDLPHVFEAYFRARGVVAEGSGLGLAMVREIVHAHDGEVVLQSEPGMGTTAILSLPRVRDDPRYGANVAEGVANG